MNVLVIDDHYLIRKSLIALFKTFNEIKVIEDAANGKEALAILKTKDIDIIFLDVRMPEMNGFDCCQEIFTLKPEAKVVVLTQLESKAVVLHFIKLGVKSFLTKNVDPKEIQKVIKEVSKGNCYFPEEILSLITNSLHQINGNSNLHIEDKEKQILSLLEQGLTSKEVAHEMHLSIKTINNYREQLLVKTKTKNVAELIAWCYKNGILN